MPTYIDALVKTTICRSNIAERAGVDEYSLPDLITVGTVFEQQAMKMVRRVVERGEQLLQESGQPTIPVPKDLEIMAGVTLEIANTFFDLQNLYLMLQEFEQMEHREFRDNILLPYREICNSLVRARRGEIPADPVQAARDVAYAALFPEANFPAPEP